MYLYISVSANSKIVEHYFSIFYGIVSFKVVNILHDLLIQFIIIIVK
jgi:hypothetical protein